MGGQECSKIDEDLGHTRTSWPWVTLSTKLVGTNREVEILSNTPIRFPLPKVWFQLKGPLWLSDVVVCENFASARRAS